MLLKCCGHIKLSRPSNFVLSPTARNEAHRDRSDLADLNLKSLADEAHATATCFEGILRNLLLLFALMVPSGTFCSSDASGSKFHILVRKVDADSASLFSVGEAQYRRRPTKKFDV